VKHNKRSDLAIASFVLLFSVLALSAIQIPKTIFYYTLSAFIHGLFTPPAYNEIYENDCWCSAGRMQYGRHSFSLS